MHEFSYPAEIVLSILIQVWFLYYHKFRDTVHDTKFLVHILKFAQQLLQHNHISIVEIVVFVNFVSRM